MSKGGGQGSFAQMQEPGLDMDMGGFGGGGLQPAPAFGRGQMDNRMGMPSFNPQPIAQPVQAAPYQPDDIAPPRQIGDAMARLPYQLQPIQDDKVGGTMYAGGTPYFNEGTGEFTKPPRGPVKLEPIKMQPLPVDTGMPPTRTPPPPPTFPRTGGSMPVERVNVPAIPDDMLADLESRGTVGPRSPNPDTAFGMGSKGGRGGSRGMSSGIGGKGGRNDRVYAGGNPNFDEFTGRYRSPPFNPRGRPPFMPGPRPPVFGPPRPAPGRNTQFQMPFFGSQYGRMNPYAGQFSGYGVPSNIYGFDQPHYQPYVPPPPAQSAPPVMQLPPDQSDQLFSGTPVTLTPTPHLLLWPLVAALVVKVSAASLQV